MNKQTKAFFGDMSSLAMGALFIAAVFVFCALAALALRFVVSIAS